MEFRYSHFALYVTRLVKFVTLASPLADDLVGFAVSDISSYSFNDGIGTIWSLSDSTVNAFQVGTDSHGGITNWELDISLPAPDSYAYGIYTDPGMWSAVATSSAPEPSAFSLAILGTLLSLGAVTCQRKRRSALGGTSMRSKV